MATAKNRGRCDRRKLRYPSDVTDDEWARVEPMLPAKRGGNKRHVDVREGMNGITDILRPGMPVAFTFNPALPVAPVAKRGPRIRTAAARVKAITRRIEAKWRRMASR